MSRKLTAVLMESDICLLHSTKERMRRPCSLGCPPDMRRQCTHHRTVHLVQRQRTLWASGLPVMTRKQRQNIKQRSARRFNLVSCCTSLVRELLGTIRILFRHRQVKYSDGQRVGLARRPKSCLSVAGTYRAGSLSGEQMSCRVAALPFSYSPSPRSLCRARVESSRLQSRSAVVQLRTLLHIACMPACKKAGSGEASSSLLSQATQRQQGIAQ